MKNTMAMEVDVEDRKERRHLITDQRCLEMNSEIKKVK